MNGKHLITIRPIRKALLCALLCYGTAAAERPDERVIVNPYASVDWDAANAYYANFHTHTTYSDGEYTPHDAIDAYKELGYHILALTDHDNDFYEARPAILYPWTELSAIHESIADKPNPSWRWEDALYGEISDPWENRDPDALNMIAVPGVEISFTHHIGSLFNDYPGFTRSEEIALNEIGKRNGLSLFFHPGRYGLYPAWYVYFYERHEHLIGMEVFNQGDRYPDDRDIWDRVLHRLMPDRPVWGFAGDDMHVTDHLGWNYNILPLEQLDKTDVRAAMESGAFYFYTPRQQMTSPSLHITRIRASPDSVRLMIDGDVEAIDWITYNPETRQSDVVHQGAELALAHVPDSATFVRARITGAEGTAYTQPFGLRGATPREPRPPPDGDLQERAGWEIFRDEGAELALDISEEHAHALKASYDLTEGHWAAITKPVDGVSEKSIIHFEVRGKGNANSLELKLEDGGDATYGQHLPMKSDDTSWSQMDIAVADLNYWWGGDEEIDLSNVRLSFAIVQREGDEGGAGRVYLNRIRITD